MKKDLHSMSNSKDRYKIMFKRSDCELSLRDISYDNIIIEEPLYSKSDRNNDNVSFIIAQNLKKLNRKFILIYLNSEYNIINSLNAKSLLSFTLKYKSVR